MAKKKNPEDLQKVGRPTVMTPEVVSKLEQAWAMGCSDLEACLFADISKQTLYDYQNKNPEFIEFLNFINKFPDKESLVLKARTVIASALNKDDENTAKWYLERKKKAEFSTRQELTGEDGASLQPPVINIYPVEAQNGGGCKDTE